MTDTNTNIWNQIIPQKSSTPTQLTYGQFSAFVLAGLGAPITQNNINKLSAIAQQEGKHGTYNPMNWVRNAPGATDYNSVGVKNYPNLGTGVLQTVAGLNQSNTLELKANLISDGPYAQFISAANKFYGSWGGGTVNVSESDANTASGTKLLEGTVTQPEIEGVAKAITPDPNIVKQLSGIVPGVNPEGATNPGGIPGILWSVGSAVKTGQDVTVGAINSVTDFLSWIKDAVFNKDNWVRIGLVIGAFILVIFGMLVISKSFGGPGATDIARKVP